MKTYYLTKEEKERYLIFQGDMRKDMILTWVMTSVIIFITIVSIILRGC